jgi:hypothetical protein
MNKKINSKGVTEMIKEKAKLIFSIFFSCKTNNKDKGSGLLGLKCLPSL